MQDVRPAAVAGMFYPGAASRLARDVRELLSAVPVAPWRPPKAVIVPHAGYVYSGPIAASAYARLAPLRDAVKRVVLLGPTHRVPVRGLATTSAHAFATPLGEVPIDRAGIEKALTLPQVVVKDASHAQEHALEVQLPFLQSVLGDFSLIPLAVGDATAREVGQVIELLWGGDETLVVISSDLSHFEPYDVGRRRDTRTAERIVALDATLEGDDACGAIGIDGLLWLARAKHMRVELVDLRSSGDTAGDRARVVGYGAFACYEGSV